MSKKSYSDILAQQVQPATDAIWKESLKLFDMKNLSALCPERFEEDELLAASLIVLSRIQLDIALTEAPRFTKALQRRAFAVGDLIEKVLTVQEKKLEAEIGSEKTALVIAAALTFMSFKKHLGIAAGRLMRQEIEGLVEQWEAEDGTETAESR